MLLLVDYVVWLLRFDSSSFALLFFLLLVALSLWLLAIVCFTCCSCWCWLFVIMMVPYGQDQMSVSQLVWSMNMLWRYMRLCVSVCVYVIKNGRRQSHAIHEGMTKNNMCKLLACSNDRRRPFNAQHSKKVLTKLFEYVYADIWLMQNKKLISFNPLYSLLWSLGVENVHFNKSNKNSENFQCALLKATSLNVQENESKLENIIISLYDSFPCRLSMRRSEEIWQPSRREIKSNRCCCWFLVFRMFWIVSDEMRQPEKRKWNEIKAKSTFSTFHCWLLFVLSIVLSFAPTAQCYEEEKKASSRLLSSCTQFETQKRSPGDISKFLSDS